MVSIRRLSYLEVLDIMREDGIVIDYVIMDSGKFIKRCFRYGIHPGVFKELFLI